MSPLAWIQSLTVDEQRKLVRETLLLRSAKRRQLKALLAAASQQRDLFSPPGHRSSLHVLQHSLTMMSSQALRLQQLQSRLLAAAQLGRPLPEGLTMRPPLPIPRAAYEATSMVPMPGTFPVRDPLFVASPQETVRRVEDDESEQEPEVFEPFPLKLYRMIQDAEEGGMGDVISFLPHGRAFAVHQPRLFVTKIMPKYFTTSRMASFQRQLNLYGFKRITVGNDVGAYCHQYFVKGYPGLLRKILRKRYSSTKKKYEARYDRGVGSLPRRRVSKCTMDYLE